MSVKSQGSQSQSDSPVEEQLLLSRPARVDCHPTVNELQGELPDATDLHLQVNVAKADPRTTTVLLQRAKSGKVRYSISKEEPEAELDTLPEHEGLVESVQLFSSVKGNQKKAMKPKANRRQTIRLSTDSLLPPPSSPSKVVALGTSRASLTTWKTVLSRVPEEEAANEEEDLNGPLKTPDTDSRSQGGRLSVSGSPGVLRAELFFQKCLQLYGQQEEFLRKMEQPSQGAVAVEEDAATLALKSIHSMDDLLEHQASLLKRQETFLEQSKTAAASEKAVGAVTLAQPQSSGGSSFYFALVMAILALFAGITVMPFFEL